MLGGCKDKDKDDAVASAAPASAASRPAGAASGPAVSVSTVAAVRRAFPVSVRATGTVTPQSIVEIRPQISSVVTKVHVREGQFVRAGEPLFTLDARTDEANLGKAQAQLARDQAMLVDAERQLDRNPAGVPGTIPTGDAPPGRVTSVTSGSTDAPFGSTALILAAIEGTLAGGALTTRAFLAGTPSEAATSPTPPRRPRRCPRCRTPSPAAVAPAGGLTR